MFIFCLFLFLFYTWHFFFKNGLAYNLQPIGSKVGEMCAVYIIKQKLPCRTVAVVVQQRCTAIANIGDTICAQLTLRRLMTKDKRQRVGNNPP